MKYLEFSPKSENKWLITLWRCVEINGCLSSCRHGLKSIVSFCYVFIIYIFVGNSAVVVQRLCTIATAIGSMVVNVNGKLQHLVIWILELKIKK